MKHLYTASITALAMATLPLAAAAQATLPKPVAKTATRITNSGFNANWESVPGAEAYCVFVYDQQPVTEAGEVTIVDEDFSGITAGSIASPLGGDELMADLSAYGFTSTYGWSAYAYPTFAPSMVAGMVYSPYLDLRADGGAYLITVEAYCTDGDTLSVVTHGSQGEVTHKVPLSVEGGGVGFATASIPCEDGSRDLFFTVINLTGDVNQTDFIDRITVTQYLEEGEVVNRMVASNEAVMAKDEDTGDSVTTARFTYPKRYTSSRTLYYDLYAVLDDWTTPNGYLPYTAVYSPFSELVKVDFDSRSSEVVTTGINATQRPAAGNDTWYTLQGQRVAHPTKGIYIHQGKKIIIK